MLYGRTPGVHLNEEGCRQAQELGEALKGRYKIDAVVSSPLERATETAQFIADPQNLVVSTEEGLNELKFGAWVGKPFSELKDLEQWRQFNKHRSTTCAPGGESLGEAQARAWKSLEGVCDASSRRDGCGDNARRYHSWSIDAAARNAAG